MPLNNCLEADMNNEINLNKECEKLAEDLVSEVIRRFVDNEEIRLNLCRPIPSGAVYGLLKQEPLNDEYNTVVVTYSIIERNEIVLNKNQLYQTAFDKMMEIVHHPDWQEEKNSPDFPQILREFAEHAVGNLLACIFSETACANPDKYPTWETHGHMPDKNNKQKLTIRRTIDF